MKWKSKNWFSNLKPPGILKVTLGTFKNEDDDMLEDKTFKKLKKNNNQAVTLIKGQPKIDTFFRKKINSYST